MTNFNEQYLSLVKKHIDGSATLWIKEGKCRIYLNGFSGKVEKSFINLDDDLKPNFDKVVSSQKPKAIALWNNLFNFDDSLPVRETIEINGAEWLDNFDYSKWGVINTEVATIGNIKTGSDGLFFLVKTDSGWKVEL